MKKKLKGVLIFAIAIITYLPISVYAIDISQADFDAAKVNPGTTSNGVTYYSDQTGEKYYYLLTGDYKLTSNLNLRDAYIFISGSTSTNYNIDFNGKNITYDGSNDAIMRLINAGNVTLKGSGYLASGIVVSHTNLTIDGIEIEATNFYQDKSAIEVTNGSNVTINSGHFIGQNAIVSIFLNQGSGQNKITINGGTFEGVDFGISLATSTNLKISEGVFKGKKASIYSGGDDDFSIYLAQGSKYSPEIKVVENEEGYTSTQKEITVAKTEEPKKEEPKTEEPIDSIKFIDGTNQKITIEKDTTITFRINIAYEEFKKSGEVYVDDKLVDPKNYELEVGSTIIKLKNDFVKDLSVKEHSFKVKYNDMEAGTKFIITKNNLNPKTGDNLLISVALIMVCITALITLYANKTKEVNDI